jgi:hypothetical protein
MNPLDAIEQRLANAAQKLLLKRLPILVKNSIGSDPGVRESIRQLLREEARSFLADQKQEWDIQTREFCTALERQAVQERQFLRGQATRKMVALRRLLRLYLTGSLQALALALLCLVATALLTVVLPTAIQRIWEPPDLRTLEAENHQLNSQVAQLRLQPVLKDRVMLYPSPDGIWAEAVSDAKPQLTDILFASREDDHQGWLIQLRQFKQQKP